MEARRWGETGRWETPADKETVERTMEALRAHNIDAYYVPDKERAKEKLFELLPEGAEVMNMTSKTLEAISAIKEVFESGKYRAVRNQFNKMDEKTQRAEMQKLGAGPEWAIGSVHAVTERGQVMVASATGSQLSAYAGGALHVIWVVGTHKIVKDIEEGFERIYEHSYPLEDDRARAAYGIGSQVGKLLIVNIEAFPGRLSLIFVNEVLGF